MEASDTSADTNDQESAMRTGKSARASSKAGRVVRIVRLFRMVRIVKLYKLKMGEDETHEEVSVDKQMQDPSQVGKKLTELTTRKVIVLMLSMIVVTPMLSGGLDAGGSNAYADYSLENLHHVPQDLNVTGDVSSQLFKTQVMAYGSANPRLLSLEICKNCPSHAHYNKAVTDSWLQEAKTTMENAAENDLTMMTDDQMGNLRPDELHRIFFNYCEPKQEGKTCESEAILDKRPAVATEVRFNIIKTLMILISFAGGVIVFTHDAQNLVIGPIERMMEVVTRLSKDPLGRTKAEVMDIDEDYVRDAQTKGYETAMLEATLEKIGGLLQVGFGVAGAEIIAKNMAEGELHVMIPGKKITSIFGFAIVNDFTETCSCLEEEICTYINTIAQIVHTNTHHYYGAANKNMGGAYLLAWKICDGTLPGLRDPRDPPQTHDHQRASMVKTAREAMFTKNHGAGRKTRKINPQEMVDSALTAFLKCQVDLHYANRRGGTLTKFLNNKRINEHFGPDFKVDMGFGLHIGWAIEGAIGSKYKIDASYLSPNVNMAARLEVATHQFGAAMLLSEFFWGELSPAAQKFCRMIDRVTVKGSQVPMALYVFDVTNFPQNFMVPKNDETGRQIPVSFEKEHHAEFVALQASVNPRFIDHFNTAVRAYIDGQWAESKKYLEEALKLKANDGPTKSLLGVLASNGYKAPASWDGFRALTSK